MFGLLVVDKPSGMTSRDVVNRVQRIVRPAKVGHAGTLDPLARGVLVLGVGPATRLIQYIQRMPKRYRGSFLLGRHSETEDIEGEVVPLADPPRPTREDVERALINFEGEIQQRPPAYSALKVQGKRAYQLARAGQPPELAPRQVTIHGIELLEYDYPRLCLELTCSAGTYVRSLGRDLAQSLGTAAVMSELLRLAVGRFGLQEACAVEELEAETLRRHLQPALRAVCDLPEIVVNGEEAQRLARGMTIAGRGHEDGGEIVACNAAGELLAILVPAARGGLRPLKNFLPADGPSVATRC